MFSSAFPWTMLLDTHSLPPEFTTNDASAPRASGAVSCWTSDIQVCLRSDLWVFAYGSLMWDPGFLHDEHQPAILRGYHRRFCVSSHRYRGTPESPGLVLGLDRGGCCRGMVYRVRPEHVPRTLDYLWEREMISHVYRPKLLPVRVGCPSGPVVNACTFVVDREHQQYCGCLSVTDQAERIARSAGERGPNLDYLANTVAHLERIGMRDARLSALLAEARRRAA